MPILEYVCKECTHHFETIVLGSQEPVCPTCQGTKLERLLSVFAVGGKATLSRRVSLLVRAAAVVIPSYPGRAR